MTYPPKLIRIIEGLRYFETFFLMYHLALVLIVLHILVFLDVVWNLPSEFNLDNTPVRNSTHIHTQFFV
jgi:hypothetical protein